MKTIQFREAICEAMTEEMRKDETVYLIGEEVAEYNGAYKASKGMLDEFGSKRVIDAPIAELGFAGISVGAAMNGNRPIVEFMTFNFSLVGIDQIINNAAKIRQMSGGQLHCPIVFRGPTGSAGQLGATHSQSFENWYANTPGLKVIVPSNPYDAKGLLKAAIRDDDPVIFMESEQMYADKGEVPEGEYIVPIGVADIKREGTDVTVVSFGKIIKEAYKAADILEKEKIRLSATSLIIKADSKTPHGFVIDAMEIANRIGLDWTYTGPADVFNEMKRTMHSLDNITWERLEREDAVTYPCDAEDQPGNDIIFGEGFPTASGRAKLVPAQLTPPDELPIPLFLPRPGVGGPGLLCALRLWRRRARRFG